MSRVCLKLYLTTWLKADLGDFTLNEVKLCLWKKGDWLTMSVAGYSIAFGGVGTAWLCVNKGSGQQKSTFDCVFIPELF